MRQKSNHTVCLKIPLSSLMSKRKKKFEFLSMIFNTHSIFHLLPTFPPLPTFLVCHKSILIHRVLENVPCSLQALQYFMLFPMPEILLSFLTASLPNKLQFNIQSSHICSPCQTQAAFHSPVSAGTHHTSWSDLFMCECSHGRKHTHLLSPVPTSVWKQRTCSICVWGRNRRKDFAFSRCSTGDVHGREPGKAFPMDLSKWPLRKRRKKRGITNILNFSNVPSPQELISCETLSLWSWIGFCQIVICHVCNRWR